jgi:hypothetical protein
MARKLSCMRAKHVQVPTLASQGRQTRTSQRVAIDRLECSCARCKDDKDDDDDGDDDDTNDPTYDQDELTFSQLADAPQGTQTQVCVSFPCSTRGCHKGLGCGLNCDALIVSFVNLGNFSLVLICVH